MPHFNPNTYGKKPFSMFEERKRFDFTDLFLAIIILLVARIGMIAGGVALFSVPFVDNLLRFGLQSLKDLIA